jgi:hypothetical protein
VTDSNKMESVSEKPLVLVTDQKITSISYIPLMIIIMYSSLLRSIEIIKIPMLTSFLAVGLNTFLNYILIFGNFGFPEMGVEGAAIATVITRFVEAIILIAIIYIKKLPGAFKFKEMFTLPFKNKVYRNFVLFSLLWNFSRSLAMPYYMFYSKTILELGYTYIAIIGSITCLVKIIVANPFGIAGDKKGWRNVLLYAGMMFALSNVAWGLINPDTTYLYPYVIIFNGIFMIGTNIAVFNLNIDLASTKDRLLFLGFNASVAAVFSFIGPNLASYLMDVLKDVDMVLFNMNINGYQIVFLISGILQGVFIYGFAMYLKKMRIGKINDKK